MNRLPVSLAWTFAAAFLGAGVLGFVPNPLLGPNGLFVANAAHNVVHLLTAVAFAGVALAGPGAATRFLQAFGVVYLLTGVLGFLTLGAQPEGRLLGVVHINQLDNFLHLGLGAAISVAGWVSRSQQRRLVAVAQS